MSLELDPTNPEPLQTLDSVRISQSNIEEATAAPRLALSLWSNDPVADLDIDEENLQMEVVEKTAKGLVDNEDQQMIDGERDVKEESCNLLIEEDQDRLSIQLVKLALECNMWSYAIEINEDGEAQYLLGMALYLLGQSKNDPKSEKDTEDSHLAPKMACAKSQLKASMLFSLDWSNNIADNMGRQLVTSGRRKTSGDIQAAFKAVTPETIRNIFR
ncbi:hypothetical protein PPACK8108_LOCUS23885 [Phakopsora pachyrhizi]|uniref:Uncharacterized protein n=1 Tax=Phakopsora pachyrhizi TaxID=170000 RepID=A0AAV0BRZ7_PHAPC|nr:hypothetical protein PPACK8108_LOCUS23885 [Phakopsora pachyrhizi]